MKKIICLLCLISCLMVLAGCGSSNEPCDYCNATPTKGYKTSQRISYVCADCSSRCAACDKKPTRKYENALGMMVFMCEEDYQSVKSFSD